MHVPERGDGKDGSRRQSILFILSLFIAHVDHTRFIVLKSFLNLNQQLKLSGAFDTRHVRTWTSSSSSAALDASAALFVFSLLTVLAFSLPFPFPYARQASERGHEESNSCLVIR